MKAHLEQVVYLIDYFQNFVLEYMNIASTDYIVDTFRHQALKIQVNLGNVNKSSAKFMSEILDFKDTNINTYVSEVQDILYVIKLAEMTHSNILDAAKRSFNDKTINKRTYNQVKKLVEIVNK